MNRIIFILSLVLIVGSCKKNQEKILPKTLSESINIMSSDLNTLLFSHALVDKFCNQEFFQIPNCLSVQSDTIAGRVTHTLDFKKENYCDYFSDSTIGIIQVSFDGNYGSIMDTITIEYQNFRSNGHVFNGKIKVFFQSNVNFTNSLQKVLISDLNVLYNENQYTWNGEFSVFFSQQKYKSSINLSSVIFNKNCTLESTESIEYEGNYSYTQISHTPYFKNGKVNFNVASDKFQTYYGVNSQNYLDYSKAICVDSTGYRFILPLSKL